MTLQDQLDAAFRGLVAAYTARMGACTIAMVDVKLKAHGGDRKPEFTIYLAGNGTTVCVVSSMIQDGTIDSGIAAAHEQIAELRTSEDGMADLYAGLQRPAKVA